MSRVSASPRPARRRRAQIEKRLHENQTILDAIDDNYDEAYADWEASSSAS